MHICSNITITYHYYYWKYLYTYIRILGNPKHNARMRGVTPQCVHLWRDVPQGRQDIFLLGWILDAVLLLAVFVVSS